MANNSNYNNIQVKPVSNNTDLRRNPTDFQMSTQFSESQNISNLLLPNTQGVSGNPLLGYQNNSFSGLYGSPGFNGSLAGYENNLQWLTDSRLQSQHNQLPSSLVPDKNINTTVHSLTPTTSHSCCVNRFGVLDSLGVSSPLPPDQGKSACDIQQFQNKTSLSMSVIDPIQSWLNLQMPAQISNNQQYCKYGERSIPQNYSVPVSSSSQINLPAIDQSDSKHNDLCIQGQDSCFENINTLNAKNIVSDINMGSNKFNDKQNTFEPGSKRMSLDNSVSKQQSSSYQSNIASKEWKTSFQTMQNYISSPNLFNTTVNDPQDNYLFTQYSMPPAKLYYPPSDSFSSFVNKSSSCITQDKPATHYSESNVSVHNTNSFINQNNVKPSSYNSFQMQNSRPISNNNITKQHVKEGDKVQHTITNSQISISLPDRPYNNSFADCCQISTSQAKAAHINRVENNHFNHIVDKTKEENKSSNLTQHTSSIIADKPSQTSKKGFRISEAESSESDESNIIVEESDIGEIESEISIEDIKKTYKSDGTCMREVQLRCFICNVTTSMKTPANHFIHMNDSFPLTTSYQTPVHKKLEQIIPIKLQPFLKIHNGFICRRCLNLIETVEVLEVQLKTAKQTISENFSKTVEERVPAVEELLHSSAQLNKQVDHLFQSGDEVDEPLQPKQNEHFTKTLLNSDHKPIEVENNSPEEENTLICDAADDDENPFKCSYCGKRLSSQTNFNLHLQQHTKEFNYYCERCGKGFPLKPSLERHLNWHNGERKEIQALCEICGEVFARKDIFKSHCIKDHLGKFPFECKECGKGFSRKISLEIHSHKHTGVRPFICEFCGLTFTTEANLKSHIRVCTKDLPFKCSLCPKSFALEHELVNHNVQHNCDNKLSCSVCNKGFDKPSDLKYHMRTKHSSERSFKCDQCEKAFKTVWNLNYHSKVVHKQEKLFPCSVCGRNFGRKVLLMDHMNSHNNEQPYKCFQCDKSFTHQTTFFTHLRTHSGKVKMKTCNECGKCIKTRMSVHMRSHSKEKPYRCTFCPLAFSVNSSLQKHILAKHGKT